MSLTSYALKTAQAHTLNAPITLFNSSVCPFCQRVWVTLEYLGIPYKHLVSDAHRGTVTSSAVDITLPNKPPELLEVSPRGLVPALKLDEYSPPRALHESIVIVQYLDELAHQKGINRALLPPPTDPYARGLIRLQLDHITSSVVPSFDRLMGARDAESQVPRRQEYLKSLDGLVSLFEKTEKELSGDANLRKYLGLWVNDQELSFADVAVGPWIFRSTNVLKKFRGFEFPEGSKLTDWAQRLLNHPAFKATCNDDEELTKVYQKLA